MSPSQTLMFKFLFNCSEIENLKQKSAICSHVPMVMIKVLLHWNLPDHIISYPLIYVRYSHLVIFWSLLYSIPSTSIFS